MAKKYEVGVEAKIHHTVELEANSLKEAEEKARNIVIYLNQDGSIDSELIKSHKIKNHYTVDVGCSVYESHELEGANNNPKD